MSRSKWKPIYIFPKVSEAINSAETDKVAISIPNRSIKLTESRVGLRIQVHNGIRWFPIEVSQERVGQRAGEFAPTRKRPIPKKVKKTIVKKK